MEDCDEDELDQIVYADMDVVVAARPTRRITQAEEQQRQTVASRIAELEEHRRNESSSQGRYMADDLENSHVPARTQAVGRAIRQKSIMLNLSHSDMLVSQGDWEEAAFAGSSNKSRSHNHATEDVDLVAPSQSSSIDASQGNMVVSSGLPSSQTASSASSKSSASIDLTVESRTSIQASQRSISTTRAAPRPQQTPSDGLGKARDLNKSLPSKPTKTAPSKPISAPRGRPLKPTSSFSSQLRRQPLAPATDSAVPSFLINDRPAHWISSGGVGVKRPRPPSRTGDKNAKSQRASVPPTTTLAAMRRLGGPQAGKEVSFKPKWISEPADHSRNDACDIQDFVGGGTYDGEGADLGSPLDGAFVDGFNPGDSPMGRESARKSNRRKSSDRVGPLVAKFRQTRSRVEGDLRRLQSGDFPLSKFLSSRGIADLRDPRTAFTSFLDVRLLERVKFAVEGFEALVAEIQAEARLDTGGQPQRLKVLEDSAMRGVVVVVVFKRAALANLSLQIDNVLRIYNPCLVTDGELVRKTCTTQASSDEEQDGVPAAEHLVLCTERHELLPPDADMQQADDVM